MTVWPQTKADYAALCHAAEKGSLSMVQLLLAQGANPYTYDDTGYCAYDYVSTAATRGQYSVAGQ